MPYRTGTGCFVQIPFMWGHGGNFVIPLPNGVTPFRFTDANTATPDIEGLILAGEAVRPLCTPMGSAASAPPRPPLDASALRAALTGHTFQSAGGRLTFDRRGFLVGEMGPSVDVGPWEVTGDGQLCRTWTVWDSARRRCYRVYREPDGVELHAVDRWGVARLRRPPSP
jgi:hypothetical protein